MPAKQTADDKVPASAQTATDPAVEPEQPERESRPVEPAAPTDVEPDSHEDIVARVRRLEQFLL